MNKVFKTSLLAVFAATLTLGVASCSDDENTTTTTTTGLTADEQEIKAFAQQYLDGTLYPTYRMLADSTAILADRLAAMRKGALSLARPQAASDVADELLGLITNTQK